MRRYLFANVSIWHHRDWLRVQNLVLFGLVSSVGNLEHCRFTHSQNAFSFSICFPFLYRLLFCVEALSSKTISDESIYAIREANRNLFVDLINSGVSLRSLSVESTHLEYLLLDHLLFGAHARVHRPSILCIIKLLQALLTLFN